MSAIDTLKVVVKVLLILFIIGAIIAGLLFFAKIFLGSIVDVGSMFS